MTKKLHCVVARGCAADVASAVEMFCDQSGPYSIESKRYSIFSLFKKLIDPVFSDYLVALPTHHSGRGIFIDTSISKLARNGGFGLAEKSLHFFIRMFLKTGHHDSEYTATLETLLDIVRQCKYKQPKSLKLGKVNRRYTEFCEFCGNQTEFAVSKIKSTWQGYEEDYAARLSVKYCSSHRPKLLDGSLNKAYLQAVRNKHDFEIELKRLKHQASDISKPSAQTGDSDLDFFYFKLITPYPVFSIDTSFLRNEACRIITLSLSDKKKRIVVMRANKNTLIEIAVKVDAKSRQAVAKALASVNKRYRFDLASYPAKLLHIENQPPFDIELTRVKVNPTAQIEFIDLMGPAGKIFFQDPAAIEILLNTDGTVWIESRLVGMKKICSISEQDAEQIVRFAANNFRQEVESDENVILAALPFANARFTGVLPPNAHRPIFGIRKGSYIAECLTDTTQAIY